MKSWLLRIFWDFIRKVPTKEIKTNWLQNMSGFYLVHTTPEFNPLHHLMSLDTIREWSVIQDWVPEYCWACPLKQNKTDHQQHQILSYKRTYKDSPLKISLMFTYLFGCSFIHLYKLFYNLVNNHNFVGPQVSLWERLSSVVQLIPEFSIFQEISFLCLKFFKSSGAGAIEQ